MCLLTLAIWAILFIITVVVMVINNQAGALTGIIALGLGVILPVVTNYWRPLIFRWHVRRRKLRDKLLAEGVLTNDDLEKGARYVECVEVKPGTEKRVSGTKQQGFLLIEGTSLRLLGEKTCFNSDNFTIIPSCTGRCSQCWVIWACGGDSFRLRTKIEDKDREFLVRCREGRTLKQTARATEMLEEMVEIEPGSGPEEKKEGAGPDPANRTPTTIDKPLDPGGESVLPKEADQPQPAQDTSSSEGESEEKDENAG